MTPDIQRGKIRSWIFPLLLSLLVSVSSIEILFLNLLKHPAWLWAIPFLIPTVRNLYENHYRDIIQLNSSCSEYNRELTYLLKPGECIFENSEYRNKFYINSAGLRDGEDSLVHPEVVVLGDSHAMGWGVDQEETFAQRIEKKTGLKVLNAAISSFGTVRERMLLDRLDTSHLKYLILQYHSSDRRENETFFMEHNALSISSLEAYQQNVKGFRRDIQYFPGKLTFVLIRDCFRKMTKIKKEKIRQRDAVESFMNAITDAGHKNLEGIQLILLETASRCLNDGGFLRGIKSKIEKGDYPGFIEKALLIRTETFLEPGRDCYLLDDHMNAHGHEAIADEISRIILKD